jgi:deoxyribodipyrimidine photo-lyase
VDWRVGEKWFERELADADLANNNGGWQWAAGTGADAAPYFRILNPVLQSKRFDPDGSYIRRHVPELAKVPAAKIHEPWTMSPEEQKAADCAIGRDYPAPIVDHAREREAALVLFEKVRKRS